MNTSGLRLSCRQPVASGLRLASSVGSCGSSAVSPVPRTRPWGPGGQDGDRASALGPSDPGRAIRGHFAVTALGRLHRLANCQGFSEAPRRTLRTDAPWCRVVLAAGRAGPEPGGRAETGQDRVINVSGLLRSQHDHERPGTLIIERAKVAGRLFRPGLVPRAGPGVRLRPISRARLIDSGAHPTNSGPTWLTPAGPARGTRVPTGVARTAVAVRATRVVL